MSEHKTPDWFTKYADWYAPSDRCSYCWWGRGALSHWILGVPVGYIASHFDQGWLMSLWVAGIGVLAVLQQDRYGKDSKTQTAE